MQTLSIESLVEKLKGSARLDEEVVACLEHMKLQELLREMIQERRLKNKVEIGVAQRNSTPDSGASSFEQCLFVVEEQGRITSLAFVQRFVVQPGLAASGEFILASEQGFRWVNDLGEWRGIPVEKKTTVLSKDLLKKYGWKFDEAQPAKV